MTGALLETHPTAGAEVKIEAVALARAQLDDRLLGASGITLVTLKAIAAGETAFCLMQRLALAQAGGDLGKALRQPRRHSQLALDRERRVGVDGQIAVDQRPPPDV